MKETRSSVEEANRENFLEQKARDQSPSLCGQRRLNFFSFFFFPSNGKKMNRSFNKSQPLRNPNCNAVEVKSKVSGNLKALLGGGVGG